MDCGGRAIATTPLWEGAERRDRLAVGKASSPLRSAGALHIPPVFLGFCRGHSLCKPIAMLKRQRQPPLHFVRLVRVHPVVKPAPRRVARIQFFISQFARLRPPPRLGGEALQHTRPAAFRIVEAVGMQAGKEPGCGV